MNCHVATLDGCDTMVKEEVNENTPDWFNQLLDEFKESYYVDYSNIKELDSNIQYHLGYVRRKSGEESGELLDEFSSFTDLLRAKVSQARQERARLTLPPPVALPTDKDGWRDYVVRNTDRLCSILPELASDMERKVYKSELEKRFVKHLPAELREPSLEYLYRRFYKVYSSL